MMLSKESRTYKSIVNSIVSLAYYAVTFFLSFFSRRIFLKELGPEVLGLNDTVGSFMSYMGLAELGIGTAVSFTLYKPLTEKDEEQINEIVSLQGWLYQWVAWVVIAASVLLLLFFPLLFSDTDVPVWYPYANYLVLLFSSMLGYFFNYREIVLTANQQHYVVQAGIGLCTIIKTIAQLVLVVYVRYKLACWLLMEVLFAIAMSAIINYQVKRCFPALAPDKSLGRSLRFKYPDIIKKTRQLFIHKIGALALNNTAPIVIFAYASLTAVTGYKNYMVITNGVSSILNSLFSGMNAGVGLLISEGNRDRIWAVFRELFTSRFLIVATSCYCIYRLSDAFIGLWLGKEYILDAQSVLLIILLFYVLTTRAVVESYINGYGLFQDVWAPFAEAVINIGASVVLGKFWGLPGILGGVLLSQVIIIMIWKPLLLFTKGLKRPVSEYILLYLKHLFLFGITVVALNRIRLIKIDPCSGFGEFVLGAIVLEGLGIIILGILLYAFERGMRDFVKRMLSSVFYAKTAS